MGGRGGEGEKERREGKEKDDIERIALPQRGHIFTRAYLPYFPITV